LHGYLLYLAWVTFVAFLPQFIDPAPVGQMLHLSAVFMAMTFVVFALYGVFAAGVAVTAG